MSHQTHQEEPNLPHLNKPAPPPTSIRINTTVSLTSKRRHPEPVDDAAADVVADTTTTTTTPMILKKKRRRCFGCAKRVGLTGIRCRCGEVFCWVHRYSDRHNCTYDYKAAGRESIATQNPVVRAPKIFKL